MTSTRRRLWGRDHGFALIEAVLAIVIVATVAIGLVTAMASSSRVAARGNESITLLQLVRSEIEVLKQAPFNQDPAAYPIISAPEGFTVSISAVDPGISYTYPPPLGTTLTNVVQKITVTAAGDFSQMSIAFYKNKMP